MGMEVKPSHGYPKANRNAGSRLAQPRLARTEASWHSNQFRLSASSFTGKSSSRVAPPSGFRVTHGFSTIERTIGQTQTHSLRFGREEGIKEPWHDLGIDALPGAEPRSGCAPLPNRTMFPPSPGVAVLFDADYAVIRAPRILNKPAVHRLSFSPLAYCCDVCAAQILSERELSNNLAAGAQIR
jgi:hypothetical protein